MVIVLSQRHHKALRSDLETAAARDLPRTVSEQCSQWEDKKDGKKEREKVDTYLDIGTLVLGLQDTVTRETGHMESISMRITNQYITRVRNIDTIREARDLLVANPVLERAIVTEHGHAMSLEVAHVKVVSCAQATE